MGPLFLIGSPAGAATAVSAAFGSKAAPLDGASVLHELLALAVAIVLAGALGTASRRLRQPRVVGEIIAGVVLGPSLLGWVSAAAFAFIFPPPAIVFLTAIGRVAIIIYMFLVGIELEPALLRQQTAATTAIAQFGILVPFAVGIGIALPLFPAFTSAAAPLDFFLFMGLALAVSGFPVLARILTDRHIHNTSIGATTLAAAALGDMTIWCLLALLLALVHARSAGAMATVAMVARQMATSIGGEELCR